MPLIDLINQKRAGKTIAPKEAAEWRERRRPDGGATSERRRRCCWEQGHLAREEVTQGDDRPEGNADADRGEETC
jgi:hypothetical protein